MPGVWAATGAKSVFLYREQPGSAQRWLVNRDGKVLDLAWFHTVH